MSPSLFFTVDICEHLTNWWHKNPFEGASEKWFRKRRGTRNVSNYAWPWPIFVQCDTRCPFVLMIFERNRQKDSKEKKEIILISKLFRWRHSHPIRITMLFVIEEMRPWSEPMKINYLFASITNSICLEKIDRKHFQSINKRIEESSVLFFQLLCWVAAQQAT